MKNFSLKYVSALAEALQRVPKRWYCEEKVPKWCVSPQADKQPPVYDCSVDLNDRGIYAVDPCDALKAYPQPRVVIVGAGMAGLSAAARLVQQGITDICILEAYGRPGGRIHSCWLGDVVAELGSSYRPLNTETHPVFKLVAEENPHPRPGVPGVTHTRGLFHTILPGTLPFPPTVKAYHVFREIEKEALYIYLHGGSKQHGSMLNFISLRVQQEVRNFPEYQQYDAARIMFGLAHMFSARSCKDMGLLCSDNSGSFMQLPGANIRVPLGFISVLAPMIREIPAGSIFFNTPVNCIYWGTSQRCGYRAIAVAEDGREFPCDYVIVTASLGVVSECASSMFCPALPSTKMDAMRCFEFITVNKIYLEYCCAFWFWQTTNLCFTITTELKNRSDWTRGIISIEIVPNSRNVICIVVRGYEAIVMERLSDRDLAESVTDVLRLVTCSCDVPYPICILRSQWRSDPYFRGSISLERCPECCESPVELSSPIPSTSDSIPPIILFAGDSTVPGHVGTIEGARLSGLREADRIVQLTLQYKGPPILVDERIKLQNKEGPCYRVVC